MNNEKAQAAFLAEIDKAYKLATAITEALDDHLGTNPEAVNWGHVGSLKYVVELLAEISEFLNIKEGD